MSKYVPLCEALEPASIPQIVAHIQEYLEENPVPDPSEYALLLAHVANLEERVSALEGENENG